MEVRKDGVMYVGKKKMRLYLDSEERSVVLRCLVDMKNRMTAEGRYTDCVDDVIIKLVNAPVKKVK